MKRVQPGFAENMRGFFGSRAFFRLTMGFFTISALWIALAGRFPMAFDEQFHLDAIRLYSQHWLPFLGSQPEGFDSLGAIARDPSYLYHYFLSFPYRVFQALHFTQTQTVIGLRLLNLSMFVAGVIVFARVLRTRLSAAMTNLAIAIFTLIPVVPFLAGQLNYDNTVFLLTALLAFSAVDIIDRLPANELDLRKVWLFLTLCVYGALVKYAMLPIVVGAFVVIVGVCVRHFWKKRLLFAYVVRRSFSRVTKPALVAMGLVLLLGIGLAGERYGVNYVRHGSLVPDCADVLTVEQCQSHGAWGRNYRMSQDNAAVARESLPSYAMTWAASMWYRLFFTLNGPGGGYQTYMPLPLPGAVAAVVFGVGVVVVAIRNRRVFRGDAMIYVVLAVVGLYVAVLFAQNYGDYKFTGEPVAINGRYLIPLLPLVAIIFGKAFSGLWTSPKLARAKYGAICLVLLLILNGGGVLTFFVRSDSSWLFPDKTFTTINTTVQRVVKPLIWEN